MIIIQAEVKRLTNRFRLFKRKVIASQNERIPVLCRTRYKPVRHKAKEMVAYGQHSGAR